MVSRYSAEALRDNLIVLMGDHDIDEPTLAARASVDRTVIRAALAADRERYPCPTSIHRMSTALGVTTVQLVSDGW